MGVESVCHSLLKGVKDFFRFLLDAVEMVVYSSFHHVSVQDKADDDYHGVAGRLRTLDGCAETGHTMCRDSSTR